MKLLYCHCGSAIDPEDDGIKTMFDQIAELMGNRIYNENGEFAR